MPVPSVLRRLLLQPRLRRSPRGLAVAVALALLASTAHAQQGKGPGLALKTDRLHVGLVRQFGELAVALEVENRSQQPITPRLRAGTEAVAEFVPPTLAPGAKGSLHLFQPVNDELGDLRKRYWFEDGVGGAPQRLVLRAFANSAYDPTRAELDFGTFEAGIDQTITLDVFSREVDRLEILALERGPKDLTLTWDERIGANGEGVRLRATLRTDGRVSALAGRLRLKTNVPTQPYMPLYLKAVAYEKVRASENPIDVGSLAPGEAFRVRVQLDRPDGESLEHARASVESGRLEVALEPCAPASAACRGLLVSGQARRPGSFKGRVALRSASGPELISLRVVGAVRPPGTARPPTPGPGPVNPSLSVRALVPAAADTAAAATAHPSIAWEARREAPPAIGYQVYRAEVRGAATPGVFRLVSDGIIGAGMPLRFEDSGAEPGRRYVYTVDALDRFGRRWATTGRYERRTPAKN